MTNALLNVVIVVKKNTSLRFLNTLNSVLQQLYSPIQVTVVDANEQNSAYSLGLQEDLSSYPQVQYLKLDQSLSMAEIRNHMLENLTGKYIAFLSANDQWDPDMASYQIHQLKGNPEAAASCANGLLRDERKASVSITPLIETLDRDPARWVVYPPIKMSAQVIYSTEAVQLSGGFDRQFVNYCDLDMILRLSRNYRVHVSEDYLCETIITSDHMDYEWTLLQDCKRLRMKYLDLLLLDRKLKQEFYTGMIHLAKINFMWLDYMIYIVMYFVTAPVRTILSQLKKLGLMMRITLRWLRRELSIIRDCLRLRVVLQRMSKGQPLKPIKPERVYPVEKVREKTVTFLSARHYQQLSALELSMNSEQRNIVIPAGVTVVQRGLFYGCEQLISIRIPNTVVEIQAHAFQRCCNLRQVILEKGSRMTKIGEYAFSGCRALEEIHLPSSLVQIGKYSFAGCVSLRQLLFRNLGNENMQNSSTFPVAIRIIPRYAFAGCSSLSAAEFGADSILELIDEGAFAGCSNLHKVVLTSLKRLGEYVFSGCYKLETLALLQIDSLESIGKGAFLYCEALSYFQLPNPLERINIRTFYGCSKLKFIKIPKKVLSINHQAFRKCPMLTDVVIFAGDIVISPTAFEKHTRIKIDGK